MKKTFVIITLLVYTILSIGMTIIVHTCGGESETMIAITSAEDPCACGDEMPTEKCCTTVVTTTKLDDTQKVSISTIVEKLVVIEHLPAPMLHTSYGSDSNALSQFAEYVSPPPNDDIHIVNSVFLI